MYALPTLLVLATFASTSQNDPDLEMDRKIEGLLLRSDLVVIGGTVGLEDIKGNTATGTRYSISVKRYIKGHSDAKAVPVIQTKEGRPVYAPGKDTKDSIWYLGNRQPDGSYVLISGWSACCERSTRDALARIDKRSRIPGMPAPPGPKPPVAVVLGIDDGHGRAVTELQVTSFKDIRLHLQFENNSGKPLSFMPMLDGSIVHWRYPHYDFEVIDSDGAPVPRPPTARCGNVDRLRDKDIVSISSGEVYRTTARIPYYFRKPLRDGRYKVRIRYTAKRDATTSGLSSPPTEEAIRKLQGVWEGTLVTNWVEIILDSSK